MKVLLVFPPTLSPLVYGLPRTPPLGICYLAAALIEKDHQVKLIDMRLKGYDSSYLETLLKKFKPRLVGISASSFDYPGAEVVFKLVRKHSLKITTILGGAYASLMGPELIKSPDIDIVVKGEGEKVLPKIIYCLEKNKTLSSCKGIIYKTKNKRIIDKSDQRKFIFDLDNLPFPRLDLLPLKEYKAAGSLELPIITSRGCPYNCIFCASWPIHGKAYRQRSAANVVDEIEHHIKKYKTKDFTILDDNFALNRKRAINICREIIKRKLDISWQCAQGFRADRGDEELFRLMRKSGCKLVAFGVESAEPKILKKIKKGETLSTIKKAIKAAKRAGLIVKAFFIVGCPGDSERSIKKMVNFFKTSGLDIPRVSNMTAYPQTELWDWVEKNGRFVTDPIDYITTHADQTAGAQFETDDFPVEEKIKMLNWAANEAEKQTISYKLTSMFGEKIGHKLFNLFQINLFRELVKKMYQLKLIKVID